MRKTPKENDMNKDWYETDNWYAPAEDKPLPEEKKQSGKKPSALRRAFSVLIVLLLLASCTLSGIAIGMQRGLPDYSDGDVGDDSSDTPAYDFDSGNMPEDWHDFFEYLYRSGSTQSTATVPMETVSERGSLKLDVVGENEGETLSYGEIYAKCAPSIVYIKAAVEGKTGYNWGTGIVASSDGYILTNTHVIEGCSYAEVGVYGGKSYDALLVGYDADTDVAVLKIDAKGLTPASFAPSSGVSVGDAAIAIGNPLGEEYCLTMTDGIVSALDRSVNYQGKTMRLLQTSAAINEGNSGGPLINDKGQVIGITNMKIISAASGVEGIGFAIPTDTVVQVVNAIMEDGAVYGRATIGIKVGPVTEEIAEYYDIPNGLYVSEVNEKSDAFRQGLCPGDIITRVNGKRCTETSDIADAKNKCEVGDKLKFRIWRDGETMDITVRIMDSTDLTG